jgi:hypothetical protein
MERINTQDDLIKRYLLGELPAAEQTVLEDEYFGDESKYDRLCKAEDELLDRYARGSLSENDRERLERSYLTNPGRRRHVMFAKALAQVVDENPAEMRAAPQTTESGRMGRPDASLSWWSQLASLPRGLHFAPRLALIIAALLIGFGGAWLVVETSRLRAQLAAARREGETQQQRAQTQAQQIAALEAQYRQLTEERERLEAQLQAAKEAASTSSRVAPATVFFALPITAFRDLDNQEPRALTIPRGAEDVRLRLDLPGHEFPSYQVMLLTADGVEVFTRKGLRPRASEAGDFVTVSIPSHKFASGDNVLALSGVNATGEIETLGKAILKVRRQ